VTVEVILATRNRHKLREVREILEGTGFSVVSTDELDASLPDIVEDADTFAGNADKKARTLAAHFGRIAIADDSGLEVDALGGAPGVYSARFAGVDGPGADEANNDRLLRDLAGVPDAERTARYRCSLAVVTPDGRSGGSDGTCEGRIGHARVGDGGFGYDPLFLVAGDAGGRTMAQLSPAEKHAISHRGVALRQLLPILRRLG
jgi:XTP/dITP diphosphohydrolase